MYEWDPHQNGFGFRDLNYWLLSGADRVLSGGKASVGRLVYGQQAEAEQSECGKRKRLSDQRDGLEFGFLIVCDVGASCDEVTEMLSDRRAA